MSPIDNERLDVIEALMERMLSGYKARTRMGKGLRRLRTMEAALDAIHAVRLVK